jgi:tryptophan-rich sensory protein
MTAPDDSGQRQSLSLAAKAATKEFVMDGTDDKRARYRPLGFFLLATLGVGGTASLFTEPSIPTWYAGLIHPAIAPPNWVFAPVWTTLYVLMAVAAWRVWLATHPRSASPFARSASKGEMSQRRVGRADQAATEGVKPEMMAFWTQLFLNFCWSGIFFGLHQIFFALAEIIVLDAVILATLLLFWRRDRLAGLLMAPYLAWTCFATLLTYEFWRLNP